MTRVFIAFLTLWVQTANARVLITTVAQVKDHVITSREVEIHGQILKVLGPSLALATREPLEEQVIREWLLFLEASTFYNSKVSSAKQQKLISQVQNKVGASKNWKRLDLSRSEVQERIRRRLEAERLYQFKKKASVLPVSQVEIETEYNQNRVRYGNLKFDEVKDKIRRLILERNLAKRMEQWFSVLEKKYKVQRFSDFKGL